MAATTATTDKAGRPAYWPDLKAMPMIRRRRRNRLASLVAALLVVNHWFLVELKPVARGGVNAVERRRQQFASGVPVTITEGKAIDATSSNDHGTGSILLIAREAGDDGGSGSGILSDGVRIAFHLTESLYPAWKIWDATGKYRCEWDASLLAPSLVYDSGHILDFAPSIHTDLNVMTVGDSTMMQLARATDVFAGGYSPSGSRLVHWIEFLGVTGEAGVTCHGTHGGGVTGTFRTQSIWGGMGGGNFWNRRARLMSKKGEGGQVVWYDYDAVVIRAPHGWMSIDQIGRDEIFLLIKHSNTVFGARTVVILTLPFNNNVNNNRTWAKVTRVNGWIREIAATWHLRNDTHGIENVLVMEYSMYDAHLIWTNGRHLGHDLTHPLELGYDESAFAAEDGFMFERLRDGTDWPPSIAMVCNDLESVAASGAKRCNRNRLFRDGMHSCSETVAPRYGAALACLLGCVYNRPPTEAPTGGKQGGGGNETAATADGDGAGRKATKRCEAACNRQFMSVLPVEEEWIGSYIAGFPT